METTKTKETYLDAKSIHIFTWPFKFNVEKEGDREFFKQVEKKGWKKKEMDFSKQSDMEKRKELFMLQQYLSIPAQNIFMPKEKEEDNICTIYQYPMKEDTQYYYYIRKQNKPILRKKKIAKGNRIFNLQEGKCKILNGKKYRLRIETIELHVYHYGVGILFIRTLNEEWENIDDIKIINDHGRRIALPFIPNKRRGFILCADEIGIVWERGTEKETGKNTTNFREYVKAFKGKKINEKDIAMLAKKAVFLEDILNGRIEGRLSEKEANGWKIKPKDLVIEAMEDDRMFLISLIRDDVLSAVIKEKESSKDMENAIYAILFADSGDSTCQASEMRKELLKEAVYPRWIDYGTVTGFTEYSMICITSETPEINDNTIKPFVIEYTVLMSLVLAQQAGISLFSEKAMKIMQKEEKTSGWVKHLKDIVIGIFGKNNSEKLIDLQEQYAALKKQLFISKFSTQQQGIELYQQAQKQLLVEKERMLMDEQMQELYEISNVRKGNQIENWGLFLAFLAIGVDVLLNCNCEVALFKYIIPIGIAIFGVIAFAKVVKFFRY